MKFTYMSDEVFVWETLNIHGFVGYTPHRTESGREKKFRWGRGVRQELCQTRVREGADGLMIQRVIRRLR